MYKINTNYSAIMIIKKNMRIFFEIIYTVLNVIDILIIKNKKI